MSPKGRLEAGRGRRGGNGWTRLAAGAIRAKNYLRGGVAAFRDRGQQTGGYSFMRAEIQSLVSDIEQSLALLRRHL